MGRHFNPHSFYYEPAEGQNPSPFHATSLPAPAPAPHVPLPFAPSPSSPLYPPLSTIDPCVLQRSGAPPQPQPQQQPGRLGGDLLPTPPSSGDSSLSAAGLSPPPSVLPQQEGRQQQQSAVEELGDFPDAPPPATSPEWRFGDNESDWEMFVVDEPDQEAAIADSSPPPPSPPAPAAESAPAPAFSREEWAVWKALGPVAGPEEVVLGADAALDIGMELDIGGEAAGSEDVINPTPALPALSALPPPPPATLPSASATPSISPAPAEKSARGRPKGSKDKTKRLPPGAKQRKKKEAERNGTLRPIGRPLKPDGELAYTRRDRKKDYKTDRRGAKQIPVRPPTQDSGDLSASVPASASAPFSASPAPAGPATAAVNPQQPPPPLAPIAEEELNSSEDEPSPSERNSRKRRREDHSSDASAPEHQPASAPSCPFPGYESYQALRDKGIDPYA